MELPLNPTTNGRGQGPLFQNPAAEPVRWPIESTRRMSAASVIFGSSKTASRTMNEGLAVPHNRGLNSFRFSSIPLLPEQQRQRHLLFQTRGRRNHANPIYDGASSPGRLRFSLFLCCMPLRPRNLGSCSSFLLLSIKKQKARMDMEF